MLIKRFLGLTAWICLLPGVAACQTNSIATPTVTATMTRVIVPEATAPADIRPTPTNIPTPGSLPAQPTHTTSAQLVAGVTVVPVQAPAGWKFAGNRQTGIQLAMPAQWVDFTGLLDDATAMRRFGNLQLIVADSKQTGTQIINDTYNSGRFVLAFTLPPSTERPEKLLEAKLAEVGVTAAGMMTDYRNGLNVAYIDVNGDPLQLITQNGAAMALRLALIAVPDNSSHVLLAMGTRPANFPAATELFSRILTTVQLASTTSLATETTVPETIIANLSHGQIYDGDLAEQEEQFFAFTAASGQYVTIIIEPVEGLDLRLTLLDPNWRTVATGDNGFAYDPELIVDVIIPRNGTYYIAVADFFGEEGAFTLTLLLSDFPQYTGGEIQFGQEVTSHLFANEQHSWVFQGTAGQTISIIATPQNEQMDIVLRLYGPEGEKLLELDEGFSGDPEVVAGYVLDVSASYTIEVKDFSARNGEYTLSLDEGGDEIDNFYDAGDLSSGDFKQEVLQENEIQAWFFNGFAGDDISIIVNPINSNVDLLIWLLSPDLVRLETVDDTLAGESERIDFTLTEDGQFIILVQDYFGEPGSYQISYTVNGNQLVESAGTVPYNVPTLATLPAGKVALWQFSAQTDEIISIKVVPGDADSDLVVVVRGPDGYLQFTLDNTGAGGAELLIEYMVPAGGEWTIAVREFQGQPAQYSIEVERR